MNLPVSRDKADELEAVIQGRRSPSIASPRVRRLAEVGELVATTIRLPAPDPQWRAALRSRLLTMPVTVSPPAPARWRTLTSRIATSARAAVATGTAGVLIGSTGVVAVAAESLPGELLHPVKLATEQVRLALSTTTAGDVDLHLAFAHERLDEATAIAGTASTPTLGGVLLDMDRHLRAATEGATAIGDEQLVVSVGTEAADIANRLVALADLLPAHQRPLVLRSLASVVVLLGGRVPPGVPAPGDAPTPEPTGEPEPTSAPTPTAPVSERPAPSPGPGSPAPTPTPGPGVVPRLPGLLEEVGEEVEELLDQLLEDLSQLVSPDGAVPLDVPLELPLDGPLVDDLTEQLDLGGLLGRD